MIKNSIKINYLADCINSHKALILDLWGVIHDGVKVFSDSYEALQQIAQQDIKVCFVTNSSQTADVLTGQLARLGIDKRLYNDIISSGDATNFGMQYYINNIGNKVYRICSYNKTLPSEFELVDKLQDANFVLLNSIDFSKDIQYYDDLLQDILAHQLDIVCVNPDVSVVHNGQVYFCAGSVADLYTKMGGKVVAFGKPHQYIYDMCLQKMQLNKEDFIAVGDSLHTDIQGANNFGVKSVLIIRHGVHRNDYNNLHDVFAQYKTYPDYYMDTLKFNS